MGEVIRMEIEPPAQPDPAPDLWDAFWTLYPRREGKKDARKMWSRMKDPEQLAAVVAAAAWRKIWSAEDRATHLIPMPATWLNGERWEDDVPQEFKRLVAPKRVEIAVEEAFVRGEIPEHIKAMIAKIKAR